MVYSNQNVSFNGGFRYSAKDIENLAKYATGVTLTNTSTLGVSEIFTSSVSNLAVSGLSWGWSNRKDLKGAFHALTQSTTALTAIRKA